MGTFVLMNKFKIAKLRDKHYYYFCILGDVALVVWLFLNLFIRTNVPIFPQLFV